MGTSWALMSDGFGNHGLIIVCMICIGAPQHWHSITGPCFEV